LTYNQTVAWANAQPSLFVNATKFRPSPPPFAEELLQLDYRAKDITES
jgi:hypothetical protein